MCREAEAALSHICGRPSPRPTRRARHPDLRRPLGTQRPHAYKPLQSVLMSVWSVLPCTRPVARTAAPLVVLLAVLVHLLACAHGPATTGMARAETAHSAGAFRGHAPEPADAETALLQSAPTHDHQPQCCDLDEPTVQPSRDIPLADGPALHVLRVEHPGTQPSAPRASEHPPASRPSGSSTGHTRSRLGVWRT